jgi:hypothetical protein
MKKVIFWIFIMTCITIQSFFIYFIAQPQFIERFISLWISFGVEQTAYTKFVFSTIEWWSIVPVVCLTLSAITLQRPSKLLSTLTLIISMIGMLALVLSIYSTSLLIPLGK